MRSWFALMIGLSLLTGCGYNDLQVKDEEIKASWGEVLNQYKRRADLIPNLVKTVQGFAQQEKDVLIGVTEARSKVGSIQATPELLNDPKAFQNFEQAQDQLSSALSRLMVVVERYPDLKSNQNFLDLQSQLEGTENRISVARLRYIESVRDYNLVVRKFPSNLTASVFGYDVKPSFTVQNEAQISEPPAVNFGESSTAH